MNIVTSFQRQADGPALVEMNLPSDDRLLGGDALPDWCDALERAAADLQIPVKVRERERGYIAAFRSHKECEDVMTRMEPIWQGFLRQRLQAPAATAYRDNPHAPKNAVEKLVGDYGFTFEDFAEYIEGVVSAGKSKMTQSYLDGLQERLQSDRLDRSASQVEEHGQSLG